MQSGDNSAEFSVDEERRPNRRWVSEHRRRRLTPQWVELLNDCTAVLALHVLLVCFILPKRRSSHSRISLVPRHCLLRAPRPTSIFAHLFPIPCGLALPWSTWSAVINLTPRTGELRSAPSWPDARHRVAGKRALALGGARSQGHNTGLRGLVPCTGFPLNCRTPPLLGASNTAILSKGWSALWVCPSCGAPPLLGASDTRIRTAPTQHLTILQE